MLDKYVKRFMNHDVLITLTDRSTITHKNDSQRKKHPRYDTTVLVNHI